MTTLDELGFAPPRYTRSNAAPRQLAGFAIVILLHIGFIYALAQGLGVHVTAILDKPLETKLIAEIKPPPPDIAPPPPPVAVAVPPPYMPPPDIVIQQPPPPHAITAVTHEKPPAPVVIAPAPPAPVAVAAPPVVVAPRPEPVRVAAQPDPAHAPGTHDYPALARRFGEEGRVVLRFTVGIDGHLSDIEIVSSSGHPRLDEAARDNLSKSLFRPATLDGKPIVSQQSFAYNWVLN